MSLESKGPRRMRVENRVIRLIEPVLRRLPKPVRFCCVGSLGLLTDMTVFTIVAAFAPHLLLARVVSLSTATCLTWRLNRALTFARSGRRQDEEAARYGSVTLVAQSVSFSTFSLLVLTVAQDFPYAAILGGAAVGAIFSYTGHRFFSFAPRRGLESRA